MIHSKTLFLCLLIFVFLQCSSADKKEVSESAPTKPISTKDKGSKSVSPPPTSGASGVSDGEAYIADTKVKEAKPSKKKPIPEEPEIKTEEKKSKITSSDSGLKAGFADDNKQFNYFLNFLDQYKTANHIDINIKERILFKVKDANGKALANAIVQIKSGLSTLVQGTTYSDGTFLFFPSEHEKIFSYTASFEKNKASKEISFDRQGLRNYEVVINTQETEEYPLDIVFILDTTGSMGGEIARLKSTIEIINLNLGGENSDKVRFGLVLYRDKGDEYRTKVIPLTSDLAKFKSALDQVTAGGGGDTPEDLQEGLKDAIEEMDWNKKAIRLGFIITDAPPHLDYGQKYDYKKASYEASKKGIKLFSIGTGGLDINGEYVLRQISQYTYAKYIFLTYGEKGESDGGRAGSVSHHTGDNFPTDKLETIIIRFAKEELAYAKGKPLGNTEEYFSASKISSERKDETLNKIFDKAVSQLIDYSTFNLVKDTTVAILPYSFENNSNKKNSEYFSEQALLSFLRNKTFKVVERKDMQKVLGEWKLNLQAIDEKNAIQVGKLLGAKLLTIGKIYVKDNNFEVYIKLVNSESGEIWSATKLIIDKKLGL